MKCLVCAPVGGFGNHVTWLLSLDSKFETASNEKHINFVLTEVYPETKGWNNWIDIERQFKDRYGDALTTDHCFYLNDNIPDVDTQTLVLHVTPELCLFAYRKLNSFLNGVSAERFCSRINSFNLGLPYLNEPNVFVLDSDVLFQPKLDRDWYNAAIDFLSLEDNYKYANIIHRRWYDLHKKAEFNIVKDLAKFYNLNTEDFL